MILDSKFVAADAASGLMLARLIVMASDAAIATMEDESGGTSLMKTCQTLSSIVNSINSHAYMSTHKADKALLLFNLLLQELGPQGQDNIYLYT